MKTVAVLNLKGGVGKTTLSVNLGDALSRLGYRVLLLDMDPQNDLTLFLGLDPAQLKGIEYFLTADMKFESLVRSYNGKFDFLPSGKKLKELEMSLSRHFRKEKKFSYLLKNAIFNAQQDYDYIIVDCPPYVGLLNFNALTFVNNLVVPIQCQHLSLQGSRRTVFFFHKMKALYNPDLKMAAIIPVMYDARNKLSDKVVEKLKKTYNGLLTETKVRVNISLAEAPGYNRTIFDYKPQSRGAKDFNKLALEMAAKI